MSFENATPRPWTKYHVFGSSNVELHGKQGPITVCPAIAHSKDDGDLILTAVNAMEPMKAALRELEAANDALCAVRSQATYDQMISDGNGDALARLDRARLKARAALRLAEGEKE